MNDPIAKRLFQNAVNSVDLGLEDFELTRRDHRHEVIDSLEWVDSDFAELVKYRFMCPNCGSEIVSIADDAKEWDGEDVRYTCRKCGKGFSYVDLCEAILPQCHCSVCDDSIDLSASC